MKDPLRPLGPAEASYIIASRISGGEVTAYMSPYQTPPAPVQLECTTMAGVVIFTGINGLICSPG